ncbi:MAG: HAD-IA family hydrolase, partial [Verrucomicrobiota bacterium]
LFSEMFGDIFTPVNRMIELNAALRSRGVPTYIFSNTNPLAVGHIRRRYPFFRDFHGHVLSCDHGAMKPDARLYEVVENVTGRKGAELLYIDDRAENVEAGRARGWRSILHRNPEMTWKEVAETGLLKSLNGDASEKEF